MRSPRNYHLNCKCWEGRADMGPSGPRGIHCCNLLESSSAVLGTCVRDDSLGKSYSWAMRQTNSYPRQRGRSRARASAPTPAGTRRPPKDPPAVRPVSCPPGRRRQTPEQSAEGNEDGGVQGRRTAEPRRTYTVKHIHQL